MSLKKILLVDDDDDSRDVLEELISGILGFETLSFDNALGALAAFEQENFDLVISDIRMPRMNGIEFLGKVRAIPKGANCPFILMTGFAELDTALMAVKYSALDYLMKPVDVNHLNDLINKALETNKDSEDEKQNEPPSRSKYSKGSIIEIPRIGKIGVFSYKLSQAIQTANLFNSDRSISVLIEGESGTGKEIIANIIHGIDNKQPFISVNCSAISANLFESELFGFIGGSFSGARSQGLSGKFELAKGGTLFLDEIGEMPLDMQPKLLRALQDKEIYRIGGQKPILTDIRVIAATNRNLKNSITQGTFREDLYHRLNLGNIYLPPLREQKESILPLAQKMLEAAATKRHKEFKFISDSAAKILENYQWSGNIRELNNVIDRVVLLYDAVELLPTHLSMISDDYVHSQNSFVLSPNSDFSLPDDKLELELIEKEIVKRALQKFAGNKTQTAEYLGISRSALRSRLE